MRLNRPLKKLSWICSKMMMNSKSLKSILNGKARKRARRLHNSGKTTGMMMMSMTTSPYN